MQKHWEIHQRLKGDIGQDWIEWMAQRAFIEFKRHGGIDVVASGAVDGLDLSYLVEAESRGAALMQAQRILAAANPGLEGDIGWESVEIECKEPQTASASPASEPQTGSGL